MLFRSAACTCTDDHVEPMTLEVCMVRVLVCWCAVTCSCTAAQLLRHGDRA